jgi:hypothetical protein
MDGALRGYLFIPRVPASVAERQRPGLSGLRHGERTKAAIASGRNCSALLKMLADLKSRTALLNMPPHPSYRRRQVRPGSGFMPGLANRLAIVRIACTARIVLAVVLLDTLCDGKFVCYL